MAATAASATAPSLALPPAPASRRPAAAALLVRSRRELATTAVAIVIYLTLAMVWLLFVGIRRVGPAVCGEECVVVAAGNRALIGTTGFLVVVSLVTVVSTIFLAFCMDTEKAPDPNDLAAADRPVLRVLILGMLAYLAFILLTLVGSLLQASSPVNGSYTEKIGSIIIDVAVVSLVLLNCSVLTPALALFVSKRIFVIWQRL